MTTLARGCEPEPVQRRYLVFPVSGLRADIFPVALRAAVCKARRLLSLPEPSLLRHLTNL